MSKAKGERRRERGIFRSGEERDRAGWVGTQRRSDVSGAIRADPLYASWQQARPAQAQFLPTRHPRPPYKALQPSHFAIPYLQSVPILPSQGEMARTKQTARVSAAARRTLPARTRKVPSYYSIAAPTKSPVKATKKVGSMLTRKTVNTQSCQLGGGEDEEDADGEGCEGGTEARAVWHKDQD